MARLTTELAQPVAGNGETPMSMWPAPAVSSDAERPASSAGRRWARRAALLIPIACLVGFAVWRLQGVGSECDADLVLEGNIDVRQVNLSFKVPGRVEAVTVDEGDRVKTGQVLGVLDARYFEDELRLARAALDQATANYERLRHGSRPEEIEVAIAQEAERLSTKQRADQEYRRAQRLSVTGSLSRQEFDQAQAAYLEAEARLKSAMATRRLSELGPRKEEIAAGKAQVDAEAAKVVISERNLTDTRLTAPNEGIILTRAREKGAIVQVGESVMSVTLTSPVWVRTYVGESDLELVRPGLPATVTTDAASGRVFQGRVGFVSPLAEFTPKTVETKELRTDLVYRLRVVVDDPGAGLRQGMPVTVKLNVASRRQRTFWERLKEALYLDRLTSLVPESETSTQER